MQQAYSILIIAVLLAFGLYRRVRRQVGFQKLQTKRLAYRVVIFFIVGILLAAVGVEHPSVYIYDLVGIILGLGLAYAAMKTTRFESREGQWYYRSSGWIGAIVIALFFGRIAFQFFTVYDVTKSMPPSPGTYETPAPFQSTTYLADPWTAGAIFILIAYYIGYLLFVLRKERDLTTRG